MPRAFLIKKKQQCAKSGISLSRTVWTDDESNDADDMDSSRYQPGFAPLTVVTSDVKAYDLSMKPKNYDENSNDREPRLNISPRPTLNLSQHPPAALVAPKAIKPTPKSAEEIAASRPIWQRQMMSPYLPYNYPMYPYPGRPSEVYPYSGSYMGPSQTSMVPPPLVPLGSTSPNADRYSPPTRERYEIVHRINPSNSPSHTTVYPGWYSDGQDSGIASSPSPSSEDGEFAQKANPTRYQCPDCNKSYSTYSGLSKHRLMHCATQAKKSFGCKYCEKVYVSLGALKMHIRTHTLPCKCKLCGKAFSRPWLLQGHIRTHTGEKPFSCPHCSRAFADRSNLRAHLQTHSEVKKYRCKTCSKTFSRMSLLLKHEDGGCAGAVAQQQIPPVDAMSWKSVDTSDVAK
ncbi:zinc finger protein SNAI2 [Caerostris darwini]|uniref:Zinc finger protein SNAI2 n=1 Tax=Caerostris darwini TaxID=1538125 RepID=A0AAV4VM43_9ARAC|nr:zinc finger protein SNAI2 [Caerostris darwini]